jgi:hypothetical protein
LGLFKGLKNIQLECHPVKRIMRYLKGTDDFGLYYKRIEKLN